MRIIMHVGRRGACRRSRRTLERSSPSLKRRGGLNIGGGGHDRFVNSAQPGVMVQFPGIASFRREWLDRSPGGRLDIGGFNGSLCRNSGWRMATSGCVRFHRCSRLRWRRRESPEEAIEAAPPPHCAMSWRYKRGRASSSFPRPAHLSAVLASGEIGPGETAILIAPYIGCGAHRCAPISPSMRDCWPLSTSEARRRRVCTRSAFLASAAREKLEARR